MVKKNEQQNISSLAKSKLKDIYKEIIVDELSKELSKQHKDTMVAVEDSLKENVQGLEVDKKQNKTVLAKLEEIIIRIDMLESKEEKELQVLANNSKTLLMGNIVLLILLVGVIAVKF